MDYSRQMIRKKVRKPAYLVLRRMLTTVSTGMGAFAEKRKPNFTHT